MPLSKIVQQKRAYEWCDDDRECSHAQKNTTFTSGGSPDIGNICKSIAQGSPVKPTSYNPPFIDYDYEPRTVGCFDDECVTPFTREDAGDHRDTDDCNADDLVMPSKTKLNAYI